MHQCLLLLFGVFPIRFIGSSIAILLNRTDDVGLRRLNRRDWISLERCFA